MIPFHGLRGVCAMAIFLGHEMDLFLAPSVGIEYLQAVSLFFYPAFHLLDSIRPLTKWQRGMEHVSFGKGDVLDSFPFTI